ncbi:protein translocase SEC61 complex subunit gamma [Candidatus Micrarchaeota archaeon]|nr:protein translocase SEC61 complex subunit gamma [Candidatus Micrarchaeota archaeon]
MKNLKFTELTKRCIRILHISRKPTGDEYAKVARVTALGIAIFGLVGFIIFILFGLIG